MPAKRMPRYEVRNDGAGPYAIFYCDACDREFRSRPDVVGTIAKEAAGGLLRGIPIVGSLASRQDPRYSYNLTPQQLDAAWSQVETSFRECPTCGRVVCLSDFDAQSGFCIDDSPRKTELAQAQAEQAAGVVRGIASAFGLGAALSGAGQAVRSAQARMARCPNDGTLAQPGTKFCPQCGTAMVQPAVQLCPKCGADTGGARFCPQCGAQQEQPAAAPTTCPNCGADVRGVKFCPSCGAKVEQPAAVPSTCPNCGADVHEARFCPSCGSKVG